jgi:hypothetical protein
MSFEFKCKTCGEIHRGMPSFGADKPLGYIEVPEEERDARCDCSSDECVIDEKWFFVRGCIEIPVHGEEDPFVWGVWVSLSKDSFDQWAESFNDKKRSQVGPFFGWLNAWISPYPDTVNLKTMVHLRDEGIRPYIELEKTDHPLSIEQHTGITVERVKELYSLIVHSDKV